MTLESLLSVLVERVGRFVEEVGQSPGRTIRFECERTAGCVEEPGMEGDSPEPEGEGAQRSHASPAALSIW